MRLIIFIVLLIAGIIHTEMIVVNFCDLQKDTKLFLEYIENEDFNLIDKNRDTLTNTDDIDLEEYKLTGEEKKEELNTSSNFSINCSFESHKSSKSKKSQKTKKSEYTNV